MFPVPLLMRRKSRSFLLLLLLSTTAFSQSREMGLMLGVMHYKTANPGTRWTPYMFGGLSLFHFNPKAKYKDEWVLLQPIGTEGQGTAQYSSRDLYKRTNVALTFGGGLKFKIARRFGLTIES